MTLDKAIPYLRKGCGIRRQSWETSTHLKLEDADIIAITGELSRKIWTINAADMAAEDWEVAGMPFHEALNALILEGKKIYHLNEGPFDGGIILRHKLIKAPGCQGARDYKFTAADIKAGDWAMLD